MIAAATREKPGAAAGGAGQAPAAFAPTDEQQAIIGAYQRARKLARAEGGPGRGLVVNAYAGTGKTTILKMLATADPYAKFCYVAYNASAKKDAAASFPRNARCFTSHGLAFRPMAHMSKRVGAGRKYVRGIELAKLMKINEPARLTADKVLAPGQLASVVKAAIRKFCYSADERISRWHVQDDHKRWTDEEIAALRVIMPPIAQRVWDTDITQPDGQLPMEHDCQPPGTLVRRVIRRGGNLGTLAEDVPIEQIREGDYVVSFTGTQRRGQIRRGGRPVTAVGCRPYSGDLITVTTTRGRQSSYTAEHRCVVRLDCDLADGNYVVYLARRGDDYRVGRTTWRTRSQGNALGLRRRAAGQDADAIWVLSVHATDSDAALEEALTAHRFGIPTWQFRSRNETMPLARFWAKAGSNVAGARACLTAHGLDLRHPLWQRGDGWANTRRPVVIRAANLLAGMLVLEPDEIAPLDNGALRAFDGSGGWSPVAVTRSRYEGMVYNLDVAEDHTYVADGIVTHNCYLKAFQLTHPRLPGDVIALDEAQDSNPCVAAMILDQIQYGTLVVMVGDTYQAIYGWRGATDAMAQFAAQDGTEVLSLTQSFRFGEAVAAEGNKLLTILGAPQALRGYGKIPSRVGKIPGAGAVPNAVLCRTNAEAFRRAIGYIQQGLKVAFPKGAGELIALVKGARDLKEGRPSEHPDLLAFATWGQVQDFAENEADGADLKQFVALVDQYGPDELLEILFQIGSEDKGSRADVTVSTAHSAKGREWRLVEIAGDFLPPKNELGTPGVMPREMAMLLYVALTRAQYVLDCEAVAWIDGYLADFLGRAESGEALATGIEGGDAASDRQDDDGLDATDPAVARAMSLGQL